MLSLLRTSGGALVELPGIIFSKIFPAGTDPSEILTNTKQKQRSTGFSLLPSEIRSQINLPFPYSLIDKLILVIYNYFESVIQLLCKIECFIPYRHSLILFRRCMLIFMTLHPKFNKRILHYYYFLHFNSEDPFFLLYNLSLRLPLILTSINII